MKIDDATKLAEQGIQQLSEAIESGHSDTLTAFLTVMGRFHRYSFQNCMMILLQRETATHVAGFQAWTKLGRHVRKGEHGIAILAPIIYRKKADDDEEETKSGVRGFKVVHVFDISQTEGEELPQFAAIHGDPGDLIERLESVIRESKIELAYEFIASGGDGLSTDGKIIIRPDLSPAQRFAVLAHEYGHALLHKGERRHETTKTIRETEAEAVAFVVCNAFGLDAVTRSADYIQLHRGNCETLAESLDFIQRCATRIIEEIQAVTLAEPQSDDALPEEPETVPDEELVVGRADYGERREERIERYQNRAERSQAEAAATHGEAKRMAGAIPFGQPILIGHHSEQRDRNYRERIHKKFGKAYELDDKAKHWSNRAASAESSEAISSDDPEAILKLKDKLDGLEQSHRLMKAINAAWRKAGQPAPEDEAGWEKVAEHPDVTMSPQEIKRLRAEFAQLVAWQPSAAVPFPSYSLQNNNANMRRIKERIEHLRQSANAVGKEVNHGICQYVENVDENRVQLIFPGKPPKETRELLKSNGFRWSRRNGAWQRLLNNGGRHAATLVIAKVKAQEATE